MHTFVLYNYFAIRKYKKHTLNDNSNVNAYSKENKINIIEWKN